MVVIGGVAAVNYSVQTFDELPVLRMIINGLN
jgi:hypothetical protein